MNDTFRDSLAVKVRQFIDDLKKNYWRIRINSPWIEFVGFWGSSCWVLTHSWYLAEERVRECQRWVWRSWHQRGLHLRGLLRPVRPENAETTKEWLSFIDLLQLISWISFYRQAGRIFRLIYYPLIIQKWPSSGHLFLLLESRRDITRDSIYILKVKAGEFFSCIPREPEKMTAR